MSNTNFDVEINLSKNELVKSSISKKKLEQITSTFYKYGVVSINNFIDPKLLKKLKSSAEKNYKYLFSELEHRGYTEKDEINSREICYRGPGRFDILYGTNKKPFTDKFLVDNPIITSILKVLLGDETKLLFRGLVIALPGAKIQQTHTDGPNLFGEFKLPLPPHCINIFIPLIDLDVNVGPTEFFLGSHNSRKYENSYTTIVPAGSIVIFDYRVFHRGLPNNSSIMRPIFYLTYSRPWFDDKINFPETSILES